MDEKMCKVILEHRQQLVPTLFTERQVDIVQKYFYHKKLTSSEQTYFYSAIRQKMEALHFLQEEFHVTGEGMIPKRVEEAKQILKKINKPKAFISGSYLYKQKYNDIDIYIIARKKKSYHKENKHFIFITEKILQNPIFISSWRCSVANFSLETKPIIKRPSFEHLNLTYQMAINEILNKEEESTMREIVFMYYLHVKKEILDSFHLYQKTKEITVQEDKVKIVNKMMRELILALYTRKYLYVHLAKFVKQLKEDYSKEPYPNFPIFIDLFSGVKNECRT